MKNWKAINITDEGGRGRYAIIDSKTNEKEIDKTNMIADYLTKENAELIVNEHNSFEDLLKISKQLYIALEKVKNHIPKKEDDLKGDTNAIMEKTKNFLVKVKNK